MNQRRLALSLALALALGAVGAGTVQAAGPVRVTDSYTETVFDDFIWELCGIESFVTVTERWTRKEFQDGSATLHVNRTFRSSDPRIPFEMGAGTRFIHPDGTEIVVGSPTRIFDPDGGGLLLIDGGRAVFGEELVIRGRAESFDADFALIYCP